VRATIDAFSAKQIHIMNKTILTLLTTILFAAGSAQAEVVFGNLGASGTNAIRGLTNGFNLTVGNWRSIGFTTGGTNLFLNSATIGLEVTTAGSADIRLDLYTGSSGSPGTSLTNTSVNLNGITPVQPYTFNLDQTLSSGTEYFIVVQQTGGSATAFWRRPNADGAVATAQNSSGWNNLGTNTAQFSTNNGVSWDSSGTGVNQAISLNAVPEPSTYALLLLTGVGALLWARRRRQI
jgi:hypothetical protein